MLFKFCYKYISTHKIDTDQHQYMLNILLNKLTNHPIYFQKKLCDIIITIYYQQDYTFNYFLNEIFNNTKSLTNLLLLSSLFNQLKDIYSVSQYKEFININLEKIIMYLSQYFLVTNDHHYQTILLTCIEEISLIDKIDHVLNLLHQYNILHELLNILQLNKVENNSLIILRIFINSLQLNHDKNEIIMYFIADYILHSSSLFHYFNHYNDELIAHLIEFLSIYLNEYIEVYYEQEHNKRQTYIVALYQLLLQCTANNNLNLSEITLDTWNTIMDYHDINNVAILKQLLNIIIQQITLSANQIKDDTLIRYRVMIEETISLLLLSLDLEFFTLLDIKNSNMYIMESILIILTIIIKDINDEIIMNNYNELEII